MTDSYPAALGVPAPVPTYFTFTLDAHAQALDGQLEGFGVAGPDPANLVRTFVTTIPVSGDTGPAAVEAFVDGYVYTDGAAKARLTLRIGDRERNVNFPHGADDEFGASVAARLRGATELPITLRLEIRPEPPDARTEARLEAVAIGVLFL